MRNLFLIVVLILGVLLIVGCSTEKIVSVDNGIEFDEQIKNSLLTQIEVEIEKRSTEYVTDILPEECILFIHEDIHYIARFSEDGKKILIRELAK